MTVIADRTGNEVVESVALTDSADERRCPLLVKGAN